MDADSQLKQFLPFLLAIAPWLILTRVPLPKTQLRGCTLLCSTLFCACPPCCLSSPLPEPSRLFSASDGIQTGPSPREGGGARRRRGSQLVNQRQATARSGTWLRGGYPSCKFTLGFSRPRFPTAKVCYCRHCEGILPELSGGERHTSPLTEGRRHGKASALPRSRSPLASRAGNLPVADCSCHCERLTREQSRFHLSACCGQARRRMGRGRRGCPEGKSSRESLESLQTRHLQPRVLSAFCQLFDRVRPDLTSGAGTLPRCEFQGGLMHGQELDWVMLVGPFQLGTF